MYDETRLNLNRQLFESVMRSLKEAGSEKEIDDVDSKFNLHFPPGEAGVDEGQYKRPKRKSMYSTFSKAGLWEVASRFGCSPEQLGLCLTEVNLVSMLRFGTAVCFDPILKVLFSMPCSKSWKIQRKHQKRWLPTLHVLCMIPLKKYLNVPGTWYVSVTLFVLIIRLPLFDPVCYFVPGSC